MTNAKENMDEKSPAIKKRREVKSKVENKNVKTNEKNKTKRIDTKKVSKKPKENTNKNQKEKRNQKQNIQSAKNEMQNKNKSTRRTKRNSKNGFEEVRMKKSPLKIIPLGGLLEIGKNITVFEYEDEIIIVDCRFSISNRRYAWSRLSCRRYNLFRKK